MDAFGRQNPARIDHNVPYPFSCQQNTAVSVILQGDFLR